MHAGAAARGGGAQGARPGETRGGRRTLRFETERLSVRDYQGNSVVNYPDIDIPYTRIHEFRHYHPESNGGVHPTAEQLSSLGQQTLIMREYSSAWKPGDEPYYPIATPESAALLAKYQAEAAKFPALVVGGRLGQYKYFDMDKSIAAALAVEV